MVLVVLFVFISFGISVRIIVDIIFFFIGVVVFGI